MCYTRRVIQVLLVIVFIMLPVYFYNHITSFLFPHGTRINESANFETTKFLFYLVGGVLLIYQIYLTNRRTKASEETARLIEKGQVQERFKNAIDQLGSNNEAVNLGAIYTLHHIAKETEYLRKSVFDILCSYVRETTSAEDYRKKERTTIKIQSILNLLFTDQKERVIYSGFNADLHDTYLGRAILDKANLNGANLCMANLFAAKLIGATLIGSDVKFTKLRYVDLIKANLSKANLCEANLCMGDLTGAELIGADLSEADIRGVYIDRSDWITKLKEWQCVGFEDIMGKYIIAEEIENGETVYIICEKID